MGIDTLLKNVLRTLEGVHVLGVDAEKMTEAKGGIRAVISAIEKAKKEEAQHEDRDEQGQKI